LTISGFNKEAAVGVIGLGIMGSSFASNLLSRGYNVHVYNRTKEKAKLQDPPRSSEEFLTSGR